MMNEHNQVKDTSNKLPNCIFYFGCLLVFIGGGAGLLGLVSPITFFNDFPDFTSWGEISYITTGWGIRNLAMCAAMLLALWFKTPSAIGAIFSMRFLTEAGDLLNTLATGHGSMETSLIVVAVVWVVVFLVPEALAAHWGITRTLSLKR
jgi:hypothetical protein